MLSYLRRVDPKAATDAEALLAPLREPTADMTYPGLDAAVIARTTRGVSDLVTRFPGAR